MLLAVRKWFKRQSLTFRLSVSISVCVLAGVAWLSFYLAEHSHPIIRAHIEGLARRPLQDAVADLASSGWETENAALTIKNTLKELSRTDVDMMRHLLHSGMQTLFHDESDAAHAWVYVFENEDVTVGTMYSAVMDEGNFQFKAKKIKDFYKLYPWFKAVPKEEEVFWSEPYIAEGFDKKSPVVTCLIPFKFVGSDKFDGLVAVSMDLAVLRKDIAKFEANSIGKYWVISPEGRFIIHPDMQLQDNATLQDIAVQNKLPQLQQAYKDIQNGKNGSIEIPVSTVFDSASMVFYAPVSDLKWGVGLVCSKKEFVAPLRDLQVKIVTFMMLWLVALLFLIHFICRRSTKPLLDLSKVALQYGDGDFSAVLPENISNDEIGVMNSAFHKMKTSLLKHIDLVREAASERQKGESELEIAQKIQQAALPGVFPTHTAFEICAVMKAAKKVGGDFYDFFFIDSEHFAVVIADVSGKGIPAALTMMNTKALISSITKNESSVSKVFYNVNNELCKGGADMFVTAFMAVLNLKTGELRYVNAGHNPPYMRTADGYKMLKVNRNIVLGALPNMKFQAQTLQMKKGDRLFLYTDGVNEAQNNAGEFYGDARLAAVLNRELQSPFDALNQIKTDVAEFTQGAEQSDDLTMLELLYCGMEQNVFVMEANVKNIDKILHYIEQNMQNNNIDIKAQNRIMVATEEIVSNIAQYAYQRLGILRLRTEIANGMYYMYFTDNGAPYDPRMRDVPNDFDAPAEERSIGGLGIYLVRQLTDFMDYKRQNGQNILTLGIKLNK